MLTLVAVPGCGDDDGDVSAADLSGHLPPAQELQLAGELQLESERELEWDNATDFIAQGVFHSEETPPSELINAIDEEGFAAAAGEFLGDEKHETSTLVAVAAFDSESGAEGARDVLHEEDLKQPCFAACTVSPVEHTVDEVPNAVAVHHAPNEGEPPPGLFAFEGYLIEFTIGSNLYLLQTSGPPGAIPEADFERAATAFYEYAAAQD